MFDPTSPLHRRDLFAYAAAAGSAWFAGPFAQKIHADEKPEPKLPAGKKYDMKKSINQWAFPYPQKMNLEQCLRLAKDAGFDGIELN